MSGQLINGGQGDTVEQQGPSYSLLQAGSVCLNREERRVQVEGQAVPLTWQEFELLALLLQSPNQVLSHREICESLWDAYGRKEHKRLAVVVCHLREKLKEAQPYTI